MSLSIFFLILQNNINKIQSHNLSKHTGWLEKIIMKYGQELLHAIKYLKLKRK